MIKLDRFQSFSRRLRRSDQSPRPIPVQPRPIALVITDLDVGGAERALFELVTRLDRRRWNPKVISLSGPGPFYQALGKRGVEAECLGLRNSEPVRGIIRLTEAIRKHRPVLIQSFLFHANIASRFAGMLAGVPRVIGGVRVAEREKAWHLIIERLTAPLTSGVVCVSKGVARDLKKRTRWPCSRLVVIPNGIDLSRFGDDPEESSPLVEELRIPPDQVIGLFVGRITRQKGLRTLLDALERPEILKLPLHLVIVGEGDQREELERRTNSSPALRGRMSWVGFREVSRSLFQAARFLVLPSEWEGMPNIVLEAMANGLPVIGTAIEGTEDLVIDGVTGWLVPPRDPSSLASAIMEATQSPETAASRGVEAHAFVLRQFQLDQVVASYERLWESVLD